MRILRLAAIVILSIVVLLAAGAVGVYLNRGRLVAAMLTAVKNRTGLDIAPARSHLHLRDHLVIELDDPRVVSGSHEVVKLSRIRATIGYHALLFSRGLPLAGLTLESPDITVPMRSSELASVPLPMSGAEAVQGLLIPLHDLGNVTWRVEITNATVRDSAGSTVIDRVEMNAYRKRWDSAVWHVSFDARLVREPLAGLRIAGHLRGGIGRETPPHQVASGKVMYWNARLGPLTAAAALRAEGESAGEFDFGLGDDGTATGSGAMSFKGLTLSGRDLTGPDPLGGYSVSLNFSASAESSILHRVVVNHAGKELFSGDAEVTDPFGKDPKVRIHVGGIAVDAVAVRAQLRHIREVPRSLSAALDQVSAANLSLAAAEFTTTVAKFRSKPLDSIREGLQFSAVLSRAAFPLPSDLRLPPISNLAVALNYSGGVLNASEGSATLGRSQLSDIAVRLDLAGGLSRIPYRLAIKANADMADLYAAEMRAMEALKFEARKRLASVGGRILIALSAEGRLVPDHPAPPDKYQVRLEANRLVVTVKGTPAPVEFRRGVILIEPGILTLDHIALATTGGDGTVNGVLGFDRNGASIRKATIDIHQMEAGLWLALVVDPTDLQVTGPIGGKVQLRADPARHGDLLADGRFVLNQGEVKFGFMRSPMLVQGTTITFTRRTMQVAMPASTLEGAPLAFSMSIADLEHPVLHIDANAQDLDFEVLKFIRMPWSPSTPPTHFPLPVRGRVQVAKGHLSDFPMTNIRTDFSYDHGAWRVWNFTANAFHGVMDLDISGRQKDDWVQIKGKVVDIDSGPLFMLSGTHKEPPVRGKMSVAGDLWADTNSDFFQTLAGKISLTMRNGMINRFTVISRMLAMIDLKSWLTANIPNPTISGLPFDTIFVDLKGVRGVFWTEQFVIQGPVMSITANGSLNLAQNTMDMSFGLFPFNTVNWLVSKIPVIGTNVAGGTSEIIAAYMHVYGPIANPSIVPMPIHSVTELVKKTLGLPINIIRPNTIK
ncbi:MAG: AsmA-like C-terminal domain-containing protein [Candidatus Binataceae bacterium]